MNIAMTNFKFEIPMAPVLATALILLALTGCQAEPPAAKFIEQSDRLHNEAFASTVIADTDLSEYVQLVADRIAQAAAEVEPARVNADFIARVRCHLVSCDTVNVFATGGLHVYVFNGLFQQCQSEEELAAAIAHAYAHLVHRDLEQTKMQPDPRMGISLVVWDLVANRFDLAKEHEADELAVRIFARAGWDPKRFPLLFEHLESVSGGNVAPDRLLLPARASVLSDEAAEAHQTARILPVADPRTFISLRKHAAQFHEPPGPLLPYLYLRAIPNCMLSGDDALQREAQERLRPRLPAPVQTLEPN